MPQRLAINRMGCTYYMNVCVRPPHHTCNNNYIHRVCHRQSRDDDHNARNRPRHTIARDSAKAHVRGLNCKNNCNKSVSSCVYRSARAVAVLRPRDRRDSRALSTAHRSIIVCVCVCGGTFAIKSRSRARARSSNYMAIGMSP